MAPDGERPEDQGRYGGRGERGGWGGPGRWGAGGRPPWWSESEAWPPEDPEAWRGTRRRWARRAGCFAIAVVLFIVLVTGSLIWALATFVGDGFASLLLGLGWVVVIGLIGRFVVTRLRAATEPMGDLIEASERIQAGEVGTQVDVRGPREVRSMARAFNAMSARLAEDAERRRRLLADVSHELRTPLTVIGGTIEGMLDGLYPADPPQLERLLAEARQMERLVEDLRTLALADAGALPLHRERVDLGRLAEDVVAAFRPQAADAGIQIGVDVDPGLSEVSLDPVRVRQVIGNLVNNALRHTLAGGSVRVTVRDDAPDLVLEVADTGRGLDPESAARAFDRFWRSGDASGAGLGLSIVRDLVTAHGGAVALESEEGRGTVVTCRFPVTDRPSSDALPSSS